MNGWKNLRKHEYLQAFILVFIVVASTVALMSGKASATSQNKYMINEKCSKMARKYTPSWAPKTGWHIDCLHGGVSSKHPTDKDLLGVTYPDSQFIFIRDDVNDELKFKSIIIHEWTHAAVASYHLKNSNNWHKWLHYINDNPNHVKGYYGAPEEVLAENTARCSLGYYYNFLPMERAKCSVIHELFPKLTTVQSKYDFD